MSIADATCDRCGRPAAAFITSMFNTEDLCLECKDTEQQHPDYQAALDAELAAVKAGDLNHPGIGYPGGWRGDRNEEGPDA